LRKQNIPNDHCSNERIVRRGSKRCNCRHNNLAQVVHRKFLLKNWQESAATARGESSNQSGFNETKVWLAPAMRGRKRFSFYGRWWQISVR